MCVEVKVNLNLFLPAVRLSLGVYIFYFNMMFNSRLSILHYFVVYGATLHCQFQSVNPFRLVDRFQWICSQSSTHVLIEHNGLHRQVRHQHLDWDSCTDLIYSSSAEYPFVGLKDCIRLILIWSQLEATKRRGNSASAGIVMSLRTGIITCSFCYLEALRAII